MSQGLFTQLYTYLNIYISLYNWAHNRAMNLYFYKIIIQISFLTCLQHICTIISNITLSRGHCCKWYSWVLHHAHLSEHSAFRHNYEIYSSFRVRIFKKLVIRVKAWSFHKIFHFWLTIYSSGFQPRIVEAQVPIMNAII